ncbi:MAG: M24 family metallopeptidase [Paracoccaceae bacterium]
MPERAKRIHGVWVHEQCDTTQTKGIMMDRLTKLRAKMAEQAVDFLAIGPGAHLVWLTGLRPHADERPLLFCVTQSYAGFLMPALEAESLGQHTDLPMILWADDEGPTRAFKGLLRAADAQDAKRIVLDETMRADFAGLVLDALPHAQRQFAMSTLGYLRMRKEDGEYRAQKANALIADDAMQAAWAAMKPGMCEQDVAQVAAEVFEAHGVKPLFTIVGAGGNGAFPHHHTGDTVLKQGDAVVIDIGGSRDGYSSDITRMVVMGDAPDGYQEIHDVVERAVQAALGVAKPGVKAHVVDDAARQVIADAGYGAYFVHRTGHGMGVEGHEEPYITAASQTILDEGMVFSIEPGIYLPDRFGIRLEDIVILRSDGPEILSELPRAVVRIGD